MPPGSGGEGFGKIRRLNSRAEFDLVFENTEARVSRKGIVMLARRNQLARSRLGMVIPKRSLRLAKDRNRIKRMVRESFRRDTRFAGPSGVDVVVLSRPGVKTEGAANLLKRLQDDLFGRLTGGAQS